MLEEITKVCDECDYTGLHSVCCSAGITNNKCHDCGKFCKKTVCDTCYGELCVKISVGITFTVYISKINGRLISQFGKNNKGKDVRCKCINIIDKFSLKVSFGKKKEAIISVSDISFDDLIK